MKVYKLSVLLSFYTDIKLFNWQSSHRHLGIIFYIVYNFNALGIVLKSYCLLISEAKYSYYKGYVPIRIIMRYTENRILVFILNLIKTNFNIYGLFFGSIS